MRPLSYRSCALGFILTLLVCLGSSCSSHNTTFDSLTNEGLIPVSTDNPHLGSNVFLAKEMEASNYLYSFLKSRGAPQAIELTGTSEKSAEMHLYYSGTRESYKATPQFDPINRSKEWIIKGPYALNRDTYRALQQLHSDNGGVFEIFGKREVLGGSARAVETRVIAPALIPTPRPTPRPAPKIVRKEPTTGPGPEVGVSGNPSNLDQEALIEALQRKLTTPTAAAAATKPAGKASEKVKASEEPAKGLLEQSKTAAESAATAAKAIPDQKAGTLAKEAPSLSDVEKEGADSKR